MKKLLTILLAVFSISSYSQTVIDDSNFEEVINGRSAFEDDGATLVVVEFYAEFNKDNAFQHWAKLKGVKYYLCDIAKSPKAKKNHKVRTVPHLIIFKEGYDEIHFKAGLDFTLSEDLEDIQEAIDKLNEESKF
ncbi:hypothetical protein N9J42_00490 [bacterium]|nr:hypothetical protein [bacterium]|tara:strand:- start:87 stop:488 length:402 start_codon:yes stop_codon:yes gene_type:complete